MGYNRNKRPAYDGGNPRYALGQTRKSTSASTSLEPRGTWALQTAVTSSGAAVVYTLQAPKAGDRLSIVALTLVSSSQAPFHVNSGSACFSYATGSTAHDMATLATQGAAFDAIALNSTQWLVLGVRGATFSTST